MSTSLRIFQFLIVFKQLAKFTSNCNSVGPLYVTFNLLSKNVTDTLLFCNNIFCLAKYLIWKENPFRKLTLFTKVNPIEYMTIKNEVKHFFAIEFNTLLNCYVQRLFPKNGKALKMKRTFQRKTLQRTWCSLLTTAKFFFNME